MKTVKMSSIEKTLKQKITSSSKLVAAQRSLRPQKSMVRIKSLKPKRLASVIDLKIRKS